MFSQKLTSFFSCGRAEHDDATDSPTMRPPVTTKVMVVGDGAVGKTSMLMRFCTSKFDENYEPTIFENQAAPVFIKNKKVLLNLFDTAGQETYEHLRPFMYPDTDVVLICFAVDSRISLQNVNEKWITEVRRHLPKVPVLLLGLKTDLRVGSPTTMTTATAAGGRLVSEASSSSLSSSDFSPGPFTPNSPSPFSPALPPPPRTVSQTSPSNSLSPNLPTGTALPHNNALSSIPENPPPTQSPSPASLSQPSPSTLSQTSPQRSGSSSQGVTERSMPDVERLGQVSPCANGGVPFITISTPRTADRLAGGARLKDNADNMSQAKANVDNAQSNAGDVADDVLQAKFAAEVCSGDNSASNRSSCVLSGNTDSSKNDLRNIGSSSSNNENTNDPLNDTVCSGGSATTTTATPTTGTTNTAETEPFPTTTTTTGTDNIKTTTDSNDNTTTNSSSIKRKTNPRTFSLNKGSSSKTALSDIEADTSSSATVFITFAEGHKVAEEIGARAYFECSAKANEGLTVIFQEAGRVALKYRRRSSTIRSIFSPKTPRNSARASFFK